MSDPSERVQQYSWNSEDDLRAKAKLTRVGWRDALTNDDGSGQKALETAIDNAERVQQEPPRPPQAPQIEALREWERDMGKLASCSEANAFIDGFEAARVEGPSRPTCSTDSPHEAHTFGGRPIQYCPGTEAEKSPEEHFFDARAPFHWNKSDVLKIMREWRAGAVQEVSPTTPTCEKNSPYHRPTSMYCLDCLPSDAPLGALLLSNRQPTEDDIKRGLEIAALLKEREKNVVRPKVYREVTAESEVEVRELREVLNDAIKIIRENCDPDSKDTFLDDEQMKKFRRAEKVLARERHPK
jgi:hypothetical protein